MGLLEGIFALALLALAIAVVAAQMRGGMQTIRHTEALNRGLMMLRGKLAELDVGLVQPQETVEGNFGRVFPGRSWRITVKPTQTEEVFLVKLEVLEGLLDAPSDDQTEDEYEAQQAQGAAEPRLVHTAYTLRVSPATVDLKRDFGFSDEQLAEASGPGTGGQAGFDFSQPFNLQDLLKLPLEDLLDLLPALIEAFGGRLGGRLAGLDKLTREDLEEALRSMGAEPADDLSGEVGEAGSEGQGGSGVGDAGTGPGGTGRSPEKPPTVEDLLGGRRPKK